MFFERLLLDGVQRPTMGSSGKFLLRRGSRESPFWCSSSDSELFSPMRGVTCLACRLELHGATSSLVVASSAKLESLQSEHWWATLPNDDLHFGGVCEVYVDCQGGCVRCHDARVPRRSASVFVLAYFAGFSLIN